jgi:uncharacterized protein YkwD
MKGKRMRNRTPLILLSVFLVVLAVTGLAIRPALASPVEPGTNQPFFAVEPVTAVQTDIDLETQADLADDSSVKVDTSLDSPSSMEASFESKVLKLINIERAKNGLHKLSMQTRLLKAAKGHSKDMANKNYFSHSGLNGSSFIDRINATGYKWSAAGENIYAGNGTFNSPQSCVNAWMNSPAHRAILLSADYTQIGIGYAFNKNSTYGGYYTADFGKPLK